MSGEESDESSRSRLQRWADASPKNRLLLEQLKSDHWLADELEKMNKVETAQRWQRLAKQLHGKDRTGELAPLRRMPRRTFRGYWGRVAAVVLLVVAGLGLGKWWTHPYQKGEALVDHLDHLNTPAGIAATKATLTLADGSVIVLDNSNNQVLPQQEGNKIVGAAGHRLIYIPAAGAGTEAGVADAKEAYNILTVPQGMQYELTLADGTKIWVNDGTSLRYPVVFTDKQRDLELKGEAYFEVTRLAGLPFRVRTPTLMTEVLGTHFNVRDYPNEPNPRTTLLEGKVSVRKGDVKMILDTAGQEARAREGEPGLQVTPVDPGKRMAWKSGYFYFDSLDIRASLEEVARWYQKKLLFKEGAALAKLGSGRARRDQPLSQLLKHIERTDLHFHEGDSTIIVSR
jgi:ferric-dicitrate binding protein FerR (iron transport regulator)